MAKLSHGKNDHCTVDVGYPKILQTRAAFTPGLIEILAIFTRGLSVQRIIRIKMWENHIISCFEFAFNSQLKFFLFLYSSIVCIQSVRSWIFGFWISNFQCGWNISLSCFEFDALIFSHRPWNIIRVYITPNQIRFGVSNAYDGPFHFSFTGVHYQIFIWFHSEIDEYIIRSCRICIEVSELQTCCFWFD